jgi:ATP-grasp domain, R2K clade family 3
LSRPRFRRGTRLSRKLWWTRAIAWCGSEGASELPALDATEPMLFHGSLGLAAAAAKAWSPGAFCKTDAFHCSAWYPLARRWLLHRDYRVLPASALCRMQIDIGEALGSPNALFIRPDSPLKPFSGRVLPVGSISLRALDFGFYFDDAELPVVAAPVRKVEREWRYLVVDQRVVAGSAYSAEGREPLADDPSGEPWKFAQTIAAELPAPEAVYVLDVCAAEGELRLLELNPFSGADLYAMDPAAVVREVSAAVSSRA